MFLYAIILALILGYIFKGNFKNLGMCKISGVYFIFIGFSIEAIIHYLIIYGVLATGILTYVLNLLMYILIFLFIYMNRKKKSLLIMGFGFFMNAIIIFLNGGVMPVGNSAIVEAGISKNVSSEGLYSLINSGTNLKFLGDVIAFKMLKGYAFSIGDILSAIGLITFIIIAMRGMYSYNIENVSRTRINNREKRNRRNKRILRANNDIKIT